MVSVHPSHIVGVRPPIKFSKKGGGGLDRISIFRGGLLGKRGVTFFKEVAVLHKK